MTGAPAGAVYAPPLAMSKPLIVRVEEILTGQAWVYLFEGGPVHVGASASNTLSIARPFILEQHGMFTFDDRAVRYQDLDPRAGTSVDGAPAGGAEHVINERTKIELGPVRLTISRRAPDEAIGDPRSSPFFAGPGLPTMVLPQRSELPPAPPPGLARAAMTATDWSIPLHDQGRMSGPIDLSTDLSLEDEDPRAYRQWAPSDERRHARDPRGPARRRTRVRGRRVLSRAGLWLSALVLFVAVVGVAGLLLQYRGLPWMPPPLAARIPPWLAGLFR